MEITDVKIWARLMGRELEKAHIQPLEAIRIRNGAFKVTGQTIRSLGLSIGDRVQVEQDDGHFLLRRDAQGEGIVEKGIVINLTGSEEFANAVPPPDAAAILLVGTEGEGSILPVVVEEHPPDVLGPRFIDELRYNYIVRHAIPGLPRDGWTPEVLRELEDMLCSEPFHTDPASIIAQGNDWVGWMTRNRILNQPDPDDGRFRESMAADIYRNQKGDGSWEVIPTTAYAILRLLALGESPSEPRIQRAAEWLLNLPETPPRPGMWMLNEEYLDEWMSRRQPREQRILAAGEIIRAHPREDVSFYCWQLHESEQDQFRGQEVQQVIPSCARHHPPACEPRITHVSAIVAEALMRCGCYNHPRMRRYINTLFHVGGAWGYWCGCGALGYYDPDIPASERSPNFNVRMAAEDGARDTSPWRWIPRVSRSAVLANKTSLSNNDTQLIPFSWYCVPGEDAFALVGTGWQNGDCWAKTNRAISQHPSFPGSLAEHLAIYQASRYQTSLGEWDQGFPAGMLAFLSLYNHSAAKSLVIKTIPWLREHQGEDSLWHHENLPQDEWGRFTKPPGPRLATFHIIAALHRFGLLERLLP